LIVMIAIFVQCPQTKDGATSFQNYYTKISVMSKNISNGKESCKHCSFCCGAVRKSSYHISKRLFLQKMVI